LRCGCEKYVSGSGKFIYQGLRRRRHRSDAIAQSAGLRGVMEFAPSLLRLSACVGAVGKNNKFRA